MAQAIAPTMDDLLAQETTDSGSEEVIEGRVVSVTKRNAWVDLGKYGVGLVIRREMGRASQLEVGKVLQVSIIEVDSDEGYSIVSVKRAVKERGWEELEQNFENKATIEVEPYDANRGGMLVELEGIRGFLPVSQLAAEHYPRVVGADKDEILQRLTSLIGKPITVRILDISRKENKLIFSEKEATREAMKDRFEKMKVGDVTKGVITGVVDFGAFVNVDGIEGLIHISEISWDRVENPSDYVKISQEVEAKIIAIDKDRLSLSLKQMSDDPWLEDVKQFKKDDVVKGKVVRITPFGAFIQLSPSVEALVHVSELGSDEENPDPEKIFQLDQTKEFTILEIDKSGRKVSLSLKEQKKPKTEKRK
jgi:small subunit ribosomal protein S1